MDLYGQTSRSIPQKTVIHLLELLFLWSSFRSLFQSGGEVMRDRWKSNPDNGKIYTGGFFRFSRHINYLGDILWITAYAMVTRNWYAVSIPLLIFFFFSFYNAPKPDRYLKEKYGEGYDRYAARTNMLILCIF